MLAILVLHLIVFLFAWIISLFSRSTDPRSQHLAVNQKKICYEPKVSSSNRQQPIVDTKVLTASGDAPDSEIIRRLVKKTEEKNAFATENQKLANKITRLQSELADSKLKFESEWHNVQDELTLKKCELEAKRRDITDLEEKNCRLKNNETSLRSNMEDKDLLLATTQAALDELRLSFDNKKGVIEHLFDQLVGLDQKKEKTIRKLNAMQAQYDAHSKTTSTMTSDVGCGTEELIHNHEIEQPKVILPETEITEPLTTLLSPGLTTPPTNSPITGPEDKPVETLIDLLEKAVAEKEVAEQRTEEPTPSLPEFKILSSVMKKVYRDKIVITGIPNADYGRVVGRKGSNIKRLEEQYGVKLSFVQSRLFITEGDAESRLAVCCDVIKSLPVVIECPKLELGNTMLFSTRFLKDLNFKHNVRINRPCYENPNGTIWGRVDQCRKAYEVLKTGCL